MLSQGHSPESYAAISLPDKMQLMHWLAAGLIGPSAAARRTYLTMSAMAKLPAFEKLFPAEHELLRAAFGASGKDDRLEANLEVVNWLRNNPLKK